MTTTQVPIGKLVDERVLVAPQPVGAAASGAALVRLLRPAHWIKNAFVLAPTIFAGLATDASAVASALLATLLFSVASSAVYVFNDLQDLAGDRAHPVKRYSRPIAAGLVSERSARILLVSLWGALLASIRLDPLLLAVVLGYVVLNAAYSLRLKQIPVVDLFCVASGFVLRVLAGAVAVDVPLSSWMLITTLCLSLYLAAIKRRQELGASGNAARSVLSEYSARLLDSYAQISAISAIVFYGLFVIEVRPALAATIPMVLFGLFRYGYLVEARGDGESPTLVLWRDLPLLGTVLAWVGVCLYALAR